MSLLLLDLRLTLRMLLRNRTFAATTIITVAFGVGAISAVFSVIYGVLLKPLPYRDPDRLVSVYQYSPAERLGRVPLSPADFRDYRRQNRVFESMATYVRQDQQYGGERSQRLVGMRVSHEFFHTLGVEPLLGRSFTREEEISAGPADTVIVSHDLWKRLLGSRPEAIGSTIRLSDSVFRVVGVIPPGFEHLSGGRRLPRGEGVEVWLPFNQLGMPRLSRVAHYCHTVARLAPAVSVQQAQAEMARLARNLETQFTDDANWHIHLERLHDDLVGHSRPTLLILAGTVAFVLLIACVNVTNLLLARSAVRQREMAIRTAIGARPSQLVRQLLLESLMLAALGGALGLLLAWWGVRALVAQAPQQLPRVQAIGLDVHVVLFTAGVSIVSALLFGMAPALAAGGDPRDSNPRGLFVGASVALSFALLTGAGLLMRSFVAISHVEPGFHSRGVLTMNTSLSVTRPAGARRYGAFYQSFVEQLAQLPGVTAAGAASNLPWTGSKDSMLFGIPGRPGPAGPTLEARSISVTPEYLRTIGVPLLAGRWLTAADHFDAPRVTLVNRALAVRYWPTIQASIGQQLYIRSPMDRDVPITIVGITGDVKDSPVDAEAPPSIYVPLLQNPTFSNSVVLRAADDSGELAGAVRELAQQAGNDLSIQGIRSMEDVVAGAVETQRFALQMVGVFAAVALALALIGVYSVVAYTVSRRSREIAIRLAVGAQPSDTVALVVGQAAKPIPLGLLAGSVASFYSTGVLTGLLYQVRPADPLTFAAVAALLAAGALAACIGPARRALHFDPLVILRGD